MFDFMIDSKLRACDVVEVSIVASHRFRDCVVVVHQKT